MIAFAWDDQSWTHAIMHAGPIQIQRRAVTSESSAGLTTRAEALQAWCKACNSTGCLSKSVEVDLRINFCA